MLAVGVTVSTGTWEAFMEPELLVTHVTKESKGPAYQWQPVSSFVPGIWTETERRQINCLESAWSGRGNASQCLRQGPLSGANCLQSSRRLLWWGDGQQFLSRNQVVGELIHHVKVFSFSGDSITMQLCRDLIYTIVTHPDVSTHMIFMSNPLFQDGIRRQSFANYTLLDSTVVTVTCFNLPYTKGLGSSFKLSDLNLKKQERHLFVMNYGLHYPMSDQGRLAWFTDVGIKFKEVYHLAAKNANFVPMWIETFPQHFPTPHGHHRALASNWESSWEHSVKFFRSNLPLLPNMCLPMVPMEDAKLGDAGYPMFSARAGADLLNAMNLSKHIGVLRVWDLLSPLYDFHINYKDCTHWCVTPGLFLPIFDRMGMLLQTSLAR